MENDLTFAGYSPVVINYNGDADDILAPMKTSSCDINIVSSFILDDLYTAKKDKIWVRIDGQRRRATEKIVYDSNVYFHHTTPSREDPWYYIYSKGQFFEDILGVFWFYGKVREYGGSTTTEIVSIRFDQSTRTWIRDDAWKMGLTSSDWDTYPKYFTDGVYSYKIHTDYTDEDNPVHYISDWGIPSGSSENGWVNTRQYTDSNGVDFLYDVEQIAKLQNGAIETLFGRDRYVWDINNKYWVQVQAYTDTDGSTYTGLYGENYMRVKDENGNIVDACVARGLGGSNWIVKLNPATAKLTRMIPLDPIIDSTDDLSNIFAHAGYPDRSGYVYYIKSNGELYHWSWEVGEWIKVVTFTGGTNFKLDFIRPKTIYFNTGIDGDMIFIKFTNEFDERNVILLYNITPPTVHKEMDFSDEYVDAMLWEGYMQPNTYSQEISQNLDQISMLCIDPVSILKFITVDKLMDKPNIVTYRELIGKSLSYVMLDAHTLYVERNVTYGGGYDGDNGLLDFSLQISNFWDESGKPDTIYTVIEEMLRPFCMSLSFSGDRWFAEAGYWIYNSNKTAGNRVFDKYNIKQDGELEFIETIYNSFVAYDMDDEWISNNTQEASIEINNTYNSVTGVVSTCVPSYSDMAIDKVNINDRDAYDHGGLNVQMNKSKGYQQFHRIVNVSTSQTHHMDVIQPIIEDKWLYLWNGVYCDPDYYLEPQTVGLDVNWHLNINKAYEYLTGTTGTPNDSGSVLNFYGGSGNPTATGKAQPQEKSVDVRKRITYYDVDNGIPPEFLDREDIKWIYSYSYARPILSKTDYTDSKWGSNLAPVRTPPIIYHQEYDNIILSTLEDNIIELDLSHSFSRTGIDVPVPVMQNNTCTNKNWGAGMRLNTADSYYFPAAWNASNAKFDTNYWARGNGTPFYDSMMIKIYVKLTDGSYMCFNGQDWFSASLSSIMTYSTHGFKLMKLMNDENMYHTDFRYNLIEPGNRESNPQKYSLTNDDVTIYLDRNGKVTDKETNDFYRFTPYKNQGVAYLAGCSEGQLSIKLPYVDDPGATVYVEIYGSELVGQTGRSDNLVIGQGSPFVEKFYYSLDNDGSQTSSQYRETEVAVGFLPMSATYIKAQHLDLDISLTVPESNLGQMFSESDIKYKISSDNMFTEEYEGPSFLVNTKNNLVASSWSYLMYNNRICDPDQFIVNGIGCRPECYVIQAYYNWLCKIRKYYSKTIKPIYDIDLSNMMGYINSPEIDYSDRQMMVISDSWDVKSNRHSIVSIEDQDMDVDSIMPFNTDEIPRRARAERYNFPTAYPRRVGNGTSRNR